MGSGEHRQSTRREFLRHSAGAAAFAAMGGITLVACDRDNGGAPNGATRTTEPASTLTRLQEQGYALVGYANEEPYGFAEGDVLTGEAPEVTRAILERLGIPEIQGVLTPFGSLIPGLNAGRFDIVAAGMFITPERCQEVVFSDPDYCITYAMAVEEGNPTGVSTLADVADNTDVQLGAISGGIVVEWAISVGVDEDRITEFPDPISGMDGVRAGRADAYIATSPAIRAALERAGSGLEMTDVFNPVVDGEPQEACGGYAFREEDTELRDAFNEELNSLRESGELLEIMSEFGFAEEEVDKAGETSQEELCA